jgi:ribosomal protein S18 acetylase RimI-like enzyme
MSEVVINIRRALGSDADAIADVHDAAWRTSYRGLIPGRELERLISRRGPAWWRKAISRGSNLLVLDFDDSVAGYVSYGRNRAPGIPYRGEIFELYLSPEHQGLGFGSRLFRAARRNLSAHGLGSVIVWALADNEAAVDFYQRMGGRIVRRSQERFGDQDRERVAFGFPDLLS